MRSILQSKTRQCLPFREALRKSKGTLIVHSTSPGDRFWASGLHWKSTELSKGFPGLNKHGGLLMEMRGNLLPENIYKPATGQSAPNFPSGTARPRPLCFHCGVVGHRLKNCYYKHRPVLCENCGVEGHKKRYCCVPPKSTMPPTNYFNSTIPHQQRAGFRFRGPILPNPVARSNPPPWTSLFSHSMSDQRYELSGLGSWPPSGHCLSRDRRLNPDAVPFRPVGLGPDVNNLQTFPPLIDISS